MSKSGAAPTISRASIITSFTHDTNLDIGVPRIIWAQMGKAHETWNASEARKVDAGNGLEKWVTHLATLDLIAVFSAIIEITSNMMADAVSAVI